MTAPSDASGNGPTTGTGDTTDIGTGPGGDDVLGEIGAAIRARRTAAAMSMRELAGRAQMSQPFLSNIENARAMPSIATLYKLAAALGVGPQEFLPGSPAHDVVLVRRGEGSPTPVGDEPGSATARLVAGGPGQTLEAHTYRIEPGQTAGDWFEHEGEDLLVVLAGRITVEFGDGRCYDLENGDTIWHIGTLAHRWHPLGETATEVLLVNARRSHAH